MPEMWISRDTPTWPAIRAVDMNALKRGNALFDVEPDGIDDSAAGVHRGPRRGFVSDICAQRHQTACSSVSLCRRQVWQVAGGNANLAAIVAKSLDDPPAEKSGSAKYDRTTGGHPTHPHQDNAHPPGQFGCSCSVQMMVRIRSPVTASHSFEKPTMSIGA